MQTLLPLLCMYLENNTPVALARVITHQGSTPRGAGAGLIADRNGLLAGTVGGGLAEGQTLEACRAALQEGTARVLDFSLTGELAAMSDMICGGNLRVLIEPLLPSAEHSSFFAAVRDSLREDGALLVTDSTDPARPLRTARINGNCLGAPLPDEAGLFAAVPADKEAGTVIHDGRTYFIEHCRPPLRMIIAGGGHVSRPTAQVAALAGFEVTVLDDRPEFSQPERFPWAAHVACVPEFRDCFSAYMPNSRTSLVIVTRGHLHDASVLAQALATKAGYIGMIGSRRKRAEVYDSLRLQGVDEEQLNRVHCPIGITIGAETPEEIAVSIVAECIAHRRQACPPKHAPR